MTVLVHPPSQNAEVSTIFRSFTSILSRASIRDVEVVLAFLAPVVATRVKDGYIDPEDADRLFTTIDVYLTDLGRNGELSQEAQQLILEGEHWHHAGEALAPSLDRFNELAQAILERHRS